jgi:pyridoxamine 5'-phosphate oxidase
MCVRDPIPPPTTADHRPIHPEAQEPETAYPLPPLRPEDLDPDPFTLFARWYALAQERACHDPSAMALATATPDGRPSVRMVLLKGFDAHGFVFYTNYESRKGRELARNPFAALVFYWPNLRRQVRISGRVVRVSDAESDAYFATRPLGSRLSAAVSPQSAVIGSREVLERRVAELAAAAPAGPPRPPFWGGLRLVPEEFEFWQSRPNRLHDRFRYTPRPEGGWQIERLAP